MTVERVIEKKVATGEAADAERHISAGGGNRETQMHMAVSTQFILICYHCTLSLRCRQ